MRIYVIYSVNPQESDDETHSRHFMTLPNKIMKLIVGTPPRINVDGFMANGKPLKKLFVHDLGQFVFYKHGHHIFS